MKNKFDKNVSKDQLNQYNLRATPARIAILDLLKDISTPIDVQNTYQYLQEKKIPTDEATVFRIMNTFVKKGLVKQTYFNGGRARYELAGLEDHHHLICEKCGSVSDFSKCNIPELEKDILKNNNFKVTNHSLEFFGLCANCQKNKNL